MNARPGVIRPRFPSDGGGTYLCSYSHETVSDFGGRLRRGPGAARKPTDSTSSELDTKTRSCWPIVVRDVRFGRGILRKLRGPVRSGPTTTSTSSSIDLLPLRVLAGCWLTEFKVPRSRQRLIADELLGKRGTFSVNPHPAQPLQRGEDGELDDVEQARGSAHLAGPRSYVRSHDQAWYGASNDSSGYSESQFKTMKYVGSGSFPSSLWFRRRSDTSCYSSCGRFLRLLQA